MSDQQPDDQRSEREAKRRMEAALKRALSTPPQPHKPISKKGGSKAASKPRRKGSRA